VRGPSLAPNAERLVAAGWREPPRAASPRAEVIVPKQNRRMNASRVKHDADTIWDDGRLAFSDVPFAAHNGRHAATVRLLRNRPPSHRWSVDRGWKLMPKRPNREVGAMLWIAGTGFAGVVAGSMLLYLLT